MLVGERMSRPVISITRDMPIHDALALFKKEKIRRAPVLKDGKLIGIISDKDLLNASPSQATSLSVWEMNYMLSKITVKEVMTREVLTVQADTPIEEAARIMADNKIGGVPVMKADKVVGMITETDLFKIFLELMGARTKGIRVTAIAEDHPGQLAMITKAIADVGGNFISFGQFATEDGKTVIVTFKVAEMKLEDVKKTLSKVVLKFIDIREC
ncbi:CBS domain-containing protein [Candidatus Villigracilis saccharophilus]|uniref:CBS domain-containing protein n=1 Tax=Candidatus Villigracilis saccharophilus TaxID=3140684 RepID=UPI003136C862|nr:CBS domain-containing protein [Anaerolineales bacterium]